MQLNRDFYRKPGAVIVRSKEANAEFRLYTSAAGDLCAQCFVGRAVKPTWAYRFRSEAEREAKIRAQIKHTIERNEAKATRRAQTHERPSVGAILSTCWGYDQTNREFYQVVAHKGKTMIELREVAQVKHYTGNMTGKTAPVNDDFIGDTIARRWTGSAKIDTCIRATLWSGETLSFSEYA
jgi:hypothetical protein